MYVFLAWMHTLQIRSIRHVELTTSYAELGRQLEIVNEASDFYFNTLTMVIDSTERTGLHPHTVARGLSVVTNIDEIFVNNGFFWNPTLGSIYKVLNLRDDDTIHSKITFLLVNWPGKSLVLEIAPKADTQSSERPNPTISIRQFSPSKNPRRYRFSTS